MIDGVPQPILWGDFLDWANVTGRIVRPSEYAILRDMDAAWREAMSVEMTDARVRIQAAAEAKAEATKQGNKRKG